MKKTIAAVLGLGVLISINNIYATGNKDNPTVNPANNMQVTFENVSMDSKLYIKDSQGHILYTEHIDKEGSYQKGFDVSSLPSNEYYFELDKKAFVSIYPFTVRDEFVELHNEQVEEIVKPLLMQDQGRVKLMRNLDQEQSIKVDIYYEGRNLVYSETIDQNGMIGRIYDFSTSASGEYLFTIRYADRTHREYLSINTIY